MYLYIYRHLMIGFWVLAWEQEPTTTVSDTVQQGSYRIVFCCGRATLPDSTRPLGRKRGQRTTGRGARIFYLLAFFLKFLTNKSLEERFQNLDP